eukprot:CAMPEP_0117527102 /NCGR_PEP_ID=MMETSP0784-20121206/36625_1 /TAXON_ID=39447 /ORGANISM="" /LENGTH=136 /DNA_ID=CAMNT_0005323345 /DNA_START=130 /DNA_END=540 /DNA_ORIENTATION=-
MGKRALQVVPENKPLKDQAHRAPFVQPHSRAIRPHQRRGAEHEAHAYPKIPQSDPEPLPDSCVGPDILVQSGHLGEDDRSLGTSQPALLPLGVQAAQDDEQADPKCRSPLEPELHAASILGGVVRKSQRRKHQQHE